jgi:hypothetical protein
MIKAKGLRRAKRAHSWRHKGPMIKAKDPGLEALQVMGLGLKALTGSSESQKRQPAATRAHRQQSKRGAEAARRA